MLFTRPMQAAATLFVSAKTATAIPASCDLLRSALIQASLDSAVCSIEFIPSATVAQRQVDLSAIVIIRDDGRFFLDVVPARPLRNADDERLALIALRELGLTPIVLTATDICREPRFANARLVWSYRKFPVSIGLRMRILQILMDDGPMALITLLSAIESARDPCPAVMSLACANLVELDLVSSPIGPPTIVRCRV